MDEDGADEKRPTAAHRTVAQLRPGTASSPGVVRPRLGRPRASEIAGSDNPREDILNAAAALISSVGYAKATTRAIAARAGLRQPSIFHYFRTKADLLAALFERIIATPAALVDMLDSADLAPAEKLYVLTYGDVRNMAATETNIALLQFINEARGERFESFWADYRRLRDAHSRYLAAGIGAGTLAAGSVAMATDVILGVIDSVAMWFVPGEHSPHQVAREIADVVALYVLADKSRLAAVRSGALAFVDGRDAVTAGASG